MFKILYAVKLSEFGHFEKRHISQKLNIFGDVKSIKVSRFINSVITSDGHFSHLFGCHKKAKISHYS